MTKHLRSQSAGHSQHFILGKLTILRLSSFRIRHYLLIAFFASLASLNASEPAGLSLLAPDGLVGWEYGGARPQGWQVAGGRLSGSAASTPLLSGWAFGDFTLRFQWSAMNGGAWRVSLPRVPSGMAME